MYSSMYAERRNERRQKKKNQNTRFSDVYNTHRQPRRTYIAIITGQRYRGQKKISGRVALNPFLLFLEICNNY